MNIMIIIIAVSYFTNFLETSVLTHCIEKLKMPAEFLEKYMKECCARELLETHYRYINMVCGLADLQTLDDENYYFET